MNRKHIYIIANFIIYLLISILVLLILYNLSCLYKVYTTPKIPQNSINVSPKYTDHITDVLIND